MRLLIALFVITLISAGCGKPQDIVFGPEPLKQIAEQGDQFKKLPEEDRSLLVGYLTVTEVSKVFGAKTKPATGRTVGEVLADARAWKEKIRVAEVEAKKREAEAEVLKMKVAAERKAVTEKISSSVVVAVIGKSILPKNYDIGRYSEILSVKFAIENKSSKVIRQLKGRIAFNDATGDEIGWLPVDFAEPLGVGKTLITGLGWTLNRFMNGEIEKIASREFSSMKTIFKPESIAFADGEVLKAQQLEP